MRALCTLLIMLHIGNKIPYAVLIVALLHSGWNDDFTFHAISQRHCKKFNMQTEYASRTHFQAALTHCIESARSRMNDRVCARL